MGDKELSARGELVRQGDRFTDRITPDGSSSWQAASGQYRLVVSLVPVSELLLAESGTSPACITARWEVAS